MKKIFGVLIITVLSLSIGCNLLSCRSVKQVQKTVYDSTATEQVIADIDFSSDSSGSKVDKSEYEKTTVIEFEDSSTAIYINPSDFIPYKPVKKITIHEKGKKDITEQAAKSVKISDSTVVNKSTHVTQKTFEKNKKSVGAVSIIVFSLAPLIILYLLYLRYRQKFS